MGREDQVAPPISGLVDDATLAEDVKVVYRYLHSSFGERKEGYTHARKLLHDWATKKGSDGETLVNLEKFWKMVADADKVLKDAASETFIAEKSRKSINQLRDLLKETIEKSQEIVA